MVYHVMNRAAGRLILFESPSDYIAFERLLSLGQRRTPMRILAYCLMSNHWHLLLWPEDDRGLSVFMHWLTTVHARRWLLARDAVGRGAVYQSRFKSIPVQTGEHLLTVWRYIERNPLRANLVLRDRNVALVEPIRLTPGTKHSGAFNSANRASGRLGCTG